MTFVAQNLRSEQELHDLKPEWDALAASIPSPMAQSDWVLSAAATIDKEASFRTIVLRDTDGTLAGIAPLMLHGRGPATTLVQIGFRTYEPPFLIARDEAALCALLGEIGHMGMPFFMRGSYADVPQATVFADAPAGGIRPRVGGSWGTALKRLDVSDLDATIAGKRRSMVKRKRKAAEKLGPLDIAFFSPGAADVDAALDELIAVETAGWKGRAGTSLHHDVELQRFYRRYARLCAERGMVRFGRITIAGSPAAMRMDVEWAGQRWELKIGFDETYADVSPGQLLTYETFNDAMMRGAKTHNFLGGYEPSWQDDWGVEVRPLVNLRRYPLSARGLVALSLDTAAYAMRRATSRLGG